MKFITLTVLLGGFVVGSIVTASPVQEKTAYQSCQVVAEKVIRTTIESMNAIEGNFSFQIDEVEKLGTSYGGSHIVRYLSKLIVTPEGFYAGSRAEVVMMVGDGECSISKINVDLNNTQPE